MKSARLSQITGPLTLVGTFAVLSALILALIAAVLIQRVDSLIDNIALQQESTLAIGQAQILLYDGLSGPERASLTSRLAHPGPLDRAVLPRLASVIQKNMSYAGAVRIKFWDTHGTVVYSDAPQAIGRRFPLDDDLALVLSGTRESAASITDLSDAENVTERTLYKRLLEVYVAIHSWSQPGRPVVGAFEEYHDLTNLYNQEASLNNNVLISVAAGFAVLYVSLFFIVRSASLRLVRQDRENARLLRDAIVRERDAGLIYGASEGFRLGTDIDAVLKNVLEAVRSTFGYLSCEMLSYNEKRTCLAARASAGETRAVLPDHGSLPGQGSVSRALLERRAITVPDVSQEPTYRQVSRWAASAIVLPMVAGDEVVGVLNVESDRRAAFGERDIRVLSILASQAALALQNANLFSQRDDLYLATLDAMARTIDARDPYTAGHSQRVATYSVAIGRTLGLDQKQLNALQRGGVLHDIGKIGVSDAVLRKPGPLTPEERTEIEQHPVIGYALLRDMSFIADVLEMVRHHHERWDGAGYPDRLAGQQIPLMARIMAVADAFDSMTSTRPYRASLPLPIARARLLEASGSQFWPPAVEALVTLIDASALSICERKATTASA